MAERMKIPFTWAILSHMRTSIYMKRIQIFNNNTNGQT